MSDKIEPALSADEWARFAAAGTRARELFDDAIGDTPSAQAFVIAMNNAALPDSDPRKITRADIQAITRVLESDVWITVAQYSAAKPLESLRATLESYLPPEPS